MKRFFGELHRLRISEREPQSLNGVGAFVKIPRASACAKNVPSFVPRSLLGCYLARLLRQGIRTENEPGQGQDVRQQSEACHGRKSFPELRQPFRTSKQGTKVCRCDQDRALTRRRAAREIIRRATPLNSMLTPTRIP